MKAMKQMKWNHLITDDDDDDGLDSRMVDRTAWTVDRTAWTVDKTARTVRMTMNRTINTYIINAYTH